MKKKYKLKKEKLCIIKNIYNFVTLIVMYH